MSYRRKQNGKRLALAGAVAGTLVAPIACGDSAEQQIQEVQEKEQNTSPLIEMIEEHGQPLRGNLVDTFVRQFRFGDIGVTIPTGSRCIAAPRASGQSVALYNSKALVWDYKDPNCEIRNEPVVILSLYSGDSEIHLLDRQPIDGSIDGGYIVEVEEQELSRRERLTTQMDRKIKRTYVPIRAGEDRQHMYEQLLPFIERFVKNKIESEQKQEAVTQEKAEEAIRKAYDAIKDE